MKNNEAKNSDGVIDLISSLEKLNQQKLEIMNEGSTKAKIWAKIEPHVRATSRVELNNLAQDLHAVPAIRPSHIKKAKIKETIMEYIETVSIGTRFVFGKRFFAAATTLAVLFFAFYPSLRFFPSVSAEKITYLSVEQGDVAIVRDGKVMPVDRDMILMEGDEIFVSDGSLAQIYFLDDSRAALGPGSEVYMQKLYVNDENNSDTEVEMLVEGGEVWVQALNLFGEEDYFSVIANDGIYTIDTAGDLNVEVSHDLVIAQVVSNLVLFEVPYEGVNKEGMLGEGTQITVNGELVIEGLQDMSEDVWWNYNLIEGENHRNAVRDYYITESAKKVKLMPSDPLHDLKEFKEVVTDAVSFDSKLEKDLDEADSRLAEAEQLISEGDEDGAQDKLDEYIEIVEEVVADEDFSEEDLEAVEAQVDEATKALSMKVSDNEELSVIQDTLDDVDEIVTEDEGDKSMKKVNNASNKLTMALGLADAGSYDSALEYLEGYSDEVLQVAMDISEVSAEERAFVVSSILDRKVENLQILKIIIDKLDSEGVDSQEAGEVKAQILFEMNALVVSLKERAIVKLTDFLAEVQSDENIQVQVLSNLKKSVPLDFDVMQKINDIEEVYFDEGEIVFLLNE